MCRILMICSAALLGGCQRGEPAQLIQSLATLTSPPLVVCHQTYGSWYFTNRSDSPVLQFEASRTVLGDEQSITVPDQGVLATFSREKAGTRYLMVATVSADDEFQLYRYHDTTGDGVPDDATRVTLLDSAPAKMYVTSFATIGDGTTYLFDARCRDIRVAIDSDSDGWPDTIATAPFAAASEYPDELEWVVGIWSDTEGHVLTSPVWSTQCHFEVQGYCSLYQRFKDTDADGEADAVDTFQRTNNHPVVKGHPYDGQSQLQVRAPIGLVVQVWDLDANGDEDTLLGSATITTSEWTSISLSPALSEGDDLAIRSTTSPSHVVKYSVIDDRPQLLGAEPAIVHTSEAQTVQFEGINLVSGMSAVLRTADGEDHSVSVDFVGQTEIRVTMPTLSDEAAGPAELLLRAPGTSASEPADASVLFEFLPEPTGE